MTIDLNKTNRDYAVFLPSISGFYVDQMANPDCRVPPGMEKGKEGLDFLKDDGYFSYQSGLYSAGHAQLDVAKANVEEVMIQQRDRKNTFILGDSGGFQIITGVLKQNWEQFYTDDSTRTKILNYLENTADYSMVLDVPTLAASEPYSSRNGIKDFQQCLDYTKFNNDWFVKHRKHQTKLLNSMQGRTLDEARYWFDETKHFPFEGWGFGGSTSKNLVIILKQLIWLRDEGYLEEGKYDHMHYLGVSRNEFSVYYTAIKRMLNRYVNPSLEITYDAASAFIMATKGQMYGDVVVNNKKMIMGGVPVVDNKLLHGSDLPLPAQSPIFERMTAGDLCYYDHGVPDMEALQAAWMEKQRKEGHGLLEIPEHFDLDAALKDKELLNDASLWKTQGRKNKIDKVGKTSWDTSSYLYVMAHNVYVNIRTLQLCNQNVDLGMAIAGDFDPLEFITVQARKSKLEISPWAPTEVLVTTKIIEDVLKSETPMDIIDSAAGFLDSRSIVSGYQDTMKTSGNLFDFE